MLYPLKFKPILKERIWGGTRLIDKYGKKPLSESSVPFGECWELSGVQDSISVVTNGFLAGNTLDELIEVYMGDLVGDKVYQEFGLEFPLLIKLIDTADYLSIQVHPDNEMASQLHHAYGKSEMWYILESEKDSWIITGFKKQIDKKNFSDIISNGTLKQYLRFENVSKDDYFFIPAGRVHAIGKGIMLIEIQQSSDITYRIYDWDRVDEKGKSRELHTNLAKDAIDFSIASDTRMHKKIELNTTQELVSCPFFKTNRLVLSNKIERDFNRLNSFIIYLCLEGDVELIANNKDIVNLTNGELALIPAVLENVALAPRKEAKLLEIYY
jgi:mannose-6-phosphate isomerase